MESHAIQSLPDEICAGGGDFCVFALLGPPGAGKTAILEQARVASDRAGARVVHVDLRQAREIWQLDKFYAWLRDRLRRDWDRRAFPSDQARVGWCDQIQKALETRKSEKVLLVFDHLESIADWCAKSLVSELRELQDRSGAGGVWKRLRCVVCGAASVYDLRRRAASPNLQFLIRPLPPWSPEAGRLKADQHLKAQGWELDADAMARLMEETRGEPGFLGAVHQALESVQEAPGLVAAPTIDRVVDDIVAHASQYPELTRPAWLYQLDPAFRERADHLMAGRTAGCADPAADVDPYQLAGAFVIRDHTGRMARFRNRLVERTIRAVSADLARGQADLSLPLYAPTRLGRACREAASLEELIARAGEAWGVLSDGIGTASLLIAHPERLRSYLCDGTVVTIEPLMRSENIPAGFDLNVGPVRVVALRWERNWLVRAKGNVGDVRVGLQVECGDAFVPTVAMRQVLRLWAMFLQPLLSKLETLGLQELARAAIAWRLPQLTMRVFVSSTYRDLRAYRDAVRDAIVRRDLRFRGMEYFGADPEGLCPADKVVAAVREADVYLGIFGGRYGSIDPATGISMTELEYREAEARRMPMMLYVFRSDAGVTMSDMETRPEALGKLQALLTRIKSGHTVCEVGSPGELGARVYEDLGKLSAAPTG